jgi:hypothetical protein
MHRILRIAIRVNSSPGLTAAFSDYAYRLYLNFVSTMFIIFSVSENFFHQLNLLELFLYSTARIITKSFVLCHVTSSQLFPRLCITECIHFKILSLTYQLIILHVSKIMTDQN